MKTNSKTSLNLLFGIFPNSGSTTSSINDQSTTDADTAEKIKSTKQKRIAVKIGILILALAILAGACFGCTVLITCMATNYFAAEFVFAGFAKGILIASSFIYGVSLLGILSYEGLSDSPTFSIIKFFEEDADIVEREELLRKRSARADSLTEHYVNFLGELAANDISETDAQKQTKIVTVPTFWDKVGGLAGLFASTIGVVFTIVDILPIAIILLFAILFSTGERTGGKGPGFSNAASFMVGATVVDQVNKIKSKQTDTQ
jgi:hypothetical protein